MVLEKNDIYMEKNKLDPFLTYIQKLRLINDPNVKAKAIKK